MNEQEDARNEARAQLQGVIELIEALETVEETGEPVEIDGHLFDDPEEIRELIHSGPLSVEVRSDWHFPDWNFPRNQQMNRPTEYKILLCTGGPAVQVVGNLSEHMEPESATIKYQWGTPWTSYPLASSEEDAVIKFARHFWYGG